MSLKEYFENKKKQEKPRPTGLQIYEVVSMVHGLTKEELYKAIQKLMRGDLKEFHLLEALPEDEEKEWLQFLIG